MKIPEAPTTAAPKPIDFDTRAPIASGVVLGESGLQFRGRRLLSLSDDVITVPYPQLMQTIGELFRTMYSDHPMAPQLRAAVAGLVLAPTPPPA